MLDQTDPNDLIVDTARRFAQERLAPTAAAREKAGRIEPEIVRELGELGFLGATLLRRLGRLRDRHRDLCPRGGGDRGRGRLRVHPRERP